jgi:hypothetical protein
MHCVKYYLRSLRFFYCVNIFNTLLRTTGESYLQAVPKRQMKRVSLREGANRRKTGMFGDFLLILTLMRLDKFDRMVSLPLIW